MIRTPEVCLERVYPITESYKETEDEPAVIRRAKALAKILKEMTLCIEDGELIVGRATSKRRGGPLLPEICWDWYLEEMDTISTREWDRLSPLTEEEKARIRQFLPYWKERAIWDKWYSLVPEDIRKLISKAFIPIGSPIDSQHKAHCSPGYEKVLVKGLKGIMKHVDAELAKLENAATPEAQKVQFLEAINISLRLPPI